MISNNIFNSDIFSGQQLYIKSGIAANSEGIKFLDSSDTTFMHLTDGGDVSVKNSINIEGNTSINNALGVGGNLIVTGDGLFEGNLSTNSALGIGSDLNISGDSIVAGNTSINNALGVGGNLTVTGDGLFEGNLSTNNALGIGSDLNISGDLIVAGNSSIKHDLGVGGNLTVTGDFTVNGTTTTINSTTLEVDDKNIELGKVDSPTDITADGGGITLKGDTDKTILFENDTDSWDFSENLILADAKHIRTDKVRARDGDGLYIVDDDDKGIFVKDGGNVGIGTDSPDRLLEIHGSQHAGNLTALKLTNNMANDSDEGVSIEFGGNDTRIMGSIESRMRSTSSNSDLIFSTNPGTNNTDLSERMRIAANGKVGIGTTTPTGNLTLMGDLQLSQIAAPSTTTDKLYNVGGTLTWNGTDLSADTNTNQLTVWNIDTDDNSSTAIGHGETVDIAGGTNITTSRSSNTITITAAATNRSQGFTLNQDAETTSAVQFARIGVNTTPSGTAGSIVATNDIIAFASSDERLKDNVTLLSDPIEKISQIKGVNFVWNDESYDHLAGHDVGVLAQDVEKVLPEVVATRDDGYKAVRYEKMVPLLIEAIKEQQQQIADLKSRLDEAGL